MDKEYIMYCVFAKESVVKMNGNRGKLAAMAGHAYLHAYWDSEPMFGYPGQSGTPNYLYQTSGKAKKVALIVDTVEQLKALQEAYKSVCGVSLVTDAGLTVFGEPTTVCLGIGPIEKSQIKEDLSTLKVFI